MREPLRGASSHSPLSERPRHFRHSALRVHADYPARNRIVVVQEGVRPYLSSPSHRSPAQTEPKSVTESGKWEYRNRPGYRFPEDLPHALTYTRAQVLSLRSSPSYNALISTLLNMQIYLLRHGIAEDAAERGPDSERALTPESATAPPRPSVSHASRKPKPTSSFRAPIDALSRRRLRCRDSELQRQNRPHPRTRPQRTPRYCDEHPFPAKVNHHPARQPRAAH